MGVPATHTGRTLRVHACIGRGGFGEVYRATMQDPHGQTEVALKVIRSDVGQGAQAVERLRDEAQLLKSLDHPSILKVFDLMPFGDRIGLLMEYVDGQDLDKCSRRGDRLGCGALLEIITRVSDALDAAYHASLPSGGKLHLIHRDIKPSNIRVGRDASVKLLDFGIARGEQVRRQAMTGRQDLIGSFQYMAPERFRSGDLTPQSDIYSLGLTLFEGLTGSRLFGDRALPEVFAAGYQRKTHDALMRKQIRQAGEAIPTSVGELILDMLAYIPSDRPSALDVSSRCEDLADACSDSLAEWCRDHQWERPRRYDAALEDTIVIELSGEATRVLHRGTDAALDLHDHPELEPQTTSANSVALRTFLTALEEAAPRPTTPPDTVRISRRTNTIRWLGAAIAAITLLALGIASLFA